MNGNPNNEQLSAWLDGELTAEARAAMEQQLADSPELQQELAELRRVSTAVRELPQIPAPADLHPAVMAAIGQTVHSEAAPMAGSQAGSDRGTRPGSGRTDSGRTGRQLRLTQLAGLAAAVSVAVGAAVWFGQQRDQQIAGNSRETPPVVHVQQDRPDALANRAEFRGTGPAGTLNESTLNGTNGPTETVGDRTRSGTSGSGTADSGQPGAVHIETHQRVLRISRNDLTEARVGDVIEAVDASDDSVAVIRLTVVDRKLGVEALQVLLTSQQFESLAGDSATGDSATGSSQSGLVAVYVESDREKLSQAISEFRSRLDFGSLEVAAPVQVATLDPETRSELGINGNGKSGSGSASQRAVILKPGSSLDRLARPATASPDRRAADRAQAVNTPSPDNGTARPVRVIFLVVDGPVSEVNRSAAPVENGAA